MKSHWLKTWPSFYTASKSGEKRFEARLNDRDYQVGDVLHLIEFDPDGLYVVGEETLDFEITYILHGGRFGIDPAWCVMSIEPITTEAAL